MKFQNGAAFVGEELKHQLRRFPADSKGGQKREHSLHEREKRAVVGPFERLVGHHHQHAKQHEAQVDGDELGRLEHQTGGGEVALDQSGFFAAFEELGQKLEFLALGTRNQRLRSLDRNAFGRDRFFLFHRLHANQSDQVEHDKANN